MSGLAERNAITKQDPFTQAGDFYRALSRGESRTLISNLAGDLGKVESVEVREIMVSYFYSADAEFGKRLASAVEVDFERVQTRAASFEQASLN